MMRKKEGTLTRCSKDEFRPSIVLQRGKRQWLSWLHVNPSNKDLALRFQVTFFFIIRSPRKQERKQGRVKGDELMVTL